MEIAVYISLPKLHVEHAFSFVVSDRSNCRGSKSNRFHLSECIY